MKIMVFVEGTILMHQAGKDVSPEDRVRQSQQAGVQREERALAYRTDTSLPEVETGSVYDLPHYLPVGNAVQKLMAWKKQGATICYLSSRRIRDELQAIQQVLETYHFPDTEHFYFRKQREAYKDVAERVLPDVLIEDDAASIGGERQMTYPHIREEIKANIVSVVIPEFGGIDHLPADSAQLLT